MYWMASTRIECEIVIIIIIPKNWFTECVDWKSKLYANKNLLTLLILHIILISGKEKETNK
jgi:hypothetical protein